MNEKRPLVYTPNTLNVFLGGTCSETTWRDEIIPRLSIPYYNPYLKGREWTDEDRKAENQARRLDCSHGLYVYSSKGTGILTIVEMTQQAIEHPENTIICFLEEPDAPWTDEQKRSIHYSREELKMYVSNIFDNLDDVVQCLNNLKV